MSGLRKIFVFRVIPIILIAMFVLFYFEILPFNEAIENNTLLFTQMQEDGEIYTIDRFGLDGSFEISTGQEFQANDIITDAPVRITGKHWFEPEDGIELRPVVWEDISEYVGVRRLLCYGVFVLWLLVLYVAYYKYAYDYKKNKRTKDFKSWWKTLGALNQTLVFATLVFAVWSVFTMVFVLIPF